MTSDTVTVLDKFTDAFPNRRRDTKSDRTISFGNGATVYFRRTRDGANTARIHVDYAKNFPNSTRLQSYLRRRKVPKDKRPDYLIRHEHADRVIAILKE